MPDAAPIRTSDGSYIAISALPAGRERLMRWLDRLAEVSSTLDLARSVAGRRGWILRIEVDPVNGTPPLVSRVKVASRADAEALADAIQRRARAGATIDQILVESSQGTAD